MAVLSPIKCESCGVQTHVSHRPNDPAPKVCHQCQRASAAKTREVALAQIANLPLEERLRRIEAWIYDYEPPRSLYDVRF